MVFFIRLVMTSLFTTRLIYSKPPNLLKCVPFTRLRGSSAYDFWEGFCPPSTSSRLEMGANGALQKMMFVFIVRFRALCKDCNLRSVKKKRERESRLRPCWHPTEVVTMNFGSLFVFFPSLFDTDISQWVEKPRFHLQELTSQVHCRETLWLRCFVITGKNLKEKRSIFV